MLLKNQNKKVFIFLTLLIFILAVSPIAYAQGCDSVGYMGRFDPDSNVTLTEVCPTCTFINISIKNPNSSNIITDGEMVLANGIFSFLVSGGNHTIDGTYIVEGYSNLDNPFKACYDILSGRNVDTGESVIYFVLMILSIFVFLFVFWGAVVIPFSNERTELNKVININWAKYLKLMFITLTYLMFMWLMNLSVAITTNFASLTQYGGFFVMLFNILTMVFYPLFVVMIIIFNITFVRDLQLRKMIIRGVAGR